MAGICDGDDDGHCSPVKKKSGKVHQGRLEVEGEKTNVTLARDAS